VIALLFTIVAACAAGDELAQLEKKLHSPDERERRSAVQDLAKIDSKEAVSHVVDALADVSPQVADEAEVQLAKIVKSPELIAELCGKRGLLAKDPWVATHAAGVLGSLSGVTVPAAALLPGLSAKSSDTKRVLCNAIEKLGASAQLTDPMKLSSEMHALRGKDDAETAAAALLALKYVSDEKSGRAIDWARDNDPPPVVCAILRLVADDQDDKSKKYVAACAKHADRSVRAQVALNLAAKPSADGLKILVAMLEGEKNARLAWSIDGELEFLSGLSGGGKASFWRDWVDHLGPEWKPVSGDPKKAHTPSGDTAVAQLAGMPIVSSQIAILVDFSGSTWEKREDGKTRKDQLDVELKKALESLPPSTLFNVIPYTATPIPWEKQLVAATPANVQRALKFFTGCKASGKGNFWDAAQLALEDPNVDTILVLTDGAPTGGHRWNIDLMHERYVERDRCRHVALDALIVDAKKGLEERWRKFCEATGGRMQAVALK
jgi:hypothetical protein